MILQSKISKQSNYDLQQYSNHYYIVIMDKSSCSVPSISLCSSRAKRNIPTKDSYMNKNPQITKDYYKLSTVENVKNVRQKKQQYKKQGQIESKIPWKQAEKNINRNAYLQRSEEKECQRKSDNFHQKNQINKQNQTKFVTQNIDPNQVLFNHKIKKLMKQVSFYEEQIINQDKNVLNEQLQELIIMKDESIKSHQQLIKSLSALID